jgi:UDP-N-acetylmuramoyl-tripeptide--D-alanyl-D-alanine ligase
MDSTSVNRSLWSGSDVISALGGRLVGPLPASVSGVSIDSRTCEGGDIFFAVAGDNHDGHDFVRSALSKGAALAVVAEARLPELMGAGSLVVVTDVLDALRKLARSARARSRARIVAVTGSVGKTGTKDMLSLMLGREALTHASAASYNNHWGVPLTLARLPRDAHYAVFEIGMNHSGEITPLVQMVRPHVAVITTVEPVHLEHFGSVDAIARAKAEIFDGIDEGGIAVLNADNPHFELLRQLATDQGLEVRSFGSSPHSDARLLTVAALPDCSVVTAAIMKQEVAYKLGAPGRHLVYNSLGALLAVKLLGADLARAALDLTDFRAPKGRGAKQTVATARGDITLLDESYNANPASMRAALALLAVTPVGAHGRRIAVLGDMLELGPQSRELHRGLSDVLLNSKIDVVFACGTFMKSLYEQLPPHQRGHWTSSSADLLSVVHDSIHGGDTVMIKGSLGSKMGLIVSAIQHMQRVDAKAG